MTVSAQPAHWSLWVRRMTLLPEYLYRCLQTARFRSRLRDLHCEGSSRSNIYTGDTLATFPLLPSLDEQERVTQGIADSIEATDQSRAISYDFVTFVTQPERTPVH